ncbi:MAG: hypothetical protein RL367_1363, partial [Pseudomonadota bacterium]
LALTERYHDFGSLGATHMSDGFMRLLAICALPELGDHASLILLDEVEDGIELHILGDLINLVTRESTAQIIATSHSPLLANSVGVDRIRFISRDGDGRTFATRAAAMPTFQTGSDYLGPGEMWTLAENHVLQSEAAELNTANGAQGGLISL